jgi:hypothetical protein
MCFMCMFYACVFSVSKAAHREPDVLYKLLLLDYSIDLSSLMLPLAFFAPQFFFFEL